MEVCLRRTTTSPLELENSVIVALLLDRSVGSEFCSLPVLED